MTKAPKDVGASVRARLLKIARERDEDFQLLLTRYANERLLYRLSASPDGSRFVLKGAMLFTLWTGDLHRATRDLDLLGFGEPNEDHVSAVFRDVLALDDQDDGIAFEPETLEVGPIRENQVYGGIRVVVDAHIAAAKVHLQIDVGFGDAVTPAPSTVDFPVLLDFPAPRLKVYPRATVVAEKLEAMVQLGMANSRMKDLYDLFVISRMFEFDGDLLVRAIRATFERRATPLPEKLPIALTSVFADDQTKNTQWAAFLRKSGVSDAGDLRRTIELIAKFVARPIQVAAGDEPWEGRWPPGGPWQG